MPQNIYRSQEYSGSLPAPEQGTSAVTAALRRFGTAAQQRSNEKAKQEGIAASNQGQTVEEPGFFAGGNARAKYSGFEAAETARVNNLLLQYDTDAEITIKDGTVEEAKEALNLREQRYAEAFPQFLTPASRAAAKANHDLNTLRLQGMVDKKEDDETTEKVRTAFGVKITNLKQYATPAEVKALEEELKSPDVWNRLTPQQQITYSAKLGNYGSKETNAAVVKYLYDSFSDADRPAAMGAFQQYLKGDYSAFTMIVGKELAANFPTEADLVRTYNTKEAKDEALLKLQRDYINKNWKNIQGIGNLLDIDPKSINRNQLDAFVDVAKAEQRAAQAEYAESIERDASKINQKLIVNGNDVSQLTESERAFIQEHGTDKQIAAIEVYDILEAETGSEDAKSAIEEDFVNGASFDEVVEKTQQLIKNDTGAVIPIDQVARQVSKITGKSKAVHDAERNNAHIEAGGVRLAKLDNNTVEGTLDAARELRETRELIQRGYPVEQRPGAMQKVLSMLSSTDKKVREAIEPYRDELALSLSGKDFTRKNLAIAVASQHNIPFDPSQWETVSNFVGNLTTFREFKGNSEEDNTLLGLQFLVLHGEEYKSVSSPDKEGKRIQLFKEFLDKNDRANEYTINGQKKLVPLTTISGNLRGRLRVHSDKAFRQPTEEELAKVALDLNQQGGGKVRTVLLNDTYYSDDGGESYSERVRVATVNEDGVITRTNFIIDMGGL